MSGLLAGFMQCYNVANIYTACVWDLLLSRLLLLVYDTKEAALLHIVYR